MIVCIKCGIEKVEAEFPRNKNHSDGLEHECKVCRRNTSKIYRQTHMEECKKRDKQKRERNKEYYKFMNKQYYVENKEKCLRQAKEWRKKNPDKAQKIYARYRATENRQIVANKWASKNRKEMQERFVERYNTDPQFNIVIRIRRRIYMAIRNQYTTKAKSSMELLGCTFEFLKEYIESKFTENMTWNKVLNGEIHLDHIRPCASFDLTDPEQQRTCFHYTNLQPLWGVDNMWKGAKWDCPTTQTQTCLT